MVTINKPQFESLVRAGLIQFGIYNKNFRVINKKKKSARKKYAVVETPDVMQHLALV